MNDEVEDSDAEVPALPAEMPEEWIDRMVGECSAFTTARVFRIEADTVWCNVGYKFESPLSISQWNDEEPPRVGDTFEVMIDDDLDVDNRPPRIVRVRRKPDWDWEALTSPFRGKLLPGRIKRRLADGFLVDIGVATLLPDASATAAMLADPQSFLGQDVQCRIVQCEPFQTIQVELA